MTRILGISGSLRAGSFNTALLRAAQQEAGDGIAFDAVTLHGIPLYDGDAEARDGLPAAVIYRLLDGQGESQPVIRRYLDRAAFKAGQEGQVVVIGDTSSDTVEAILGWALEGKGAAVALAPVSAVLLGKK